MLDRLVRDREFTQVVTDHLGFDFDLVELLSRVYTNHRPDHLWHDDHVSEMRLDQIWLLVGPSLLLRLSQLLNQTHRSSLETTVEPSSRTGVQYVEQFIRRDVE